MGFKIANSGIRVHVGSVKENGVVKPVCVIVLENEVEEDKLTLIRDDLSFPHAKEAMNYSKGVVLIDAGPQPVHGQFIFKCLSHTAHTVALYDNETKSYSVMMGELLGRKVGESVPEALIKPRCAWRDFGSKRDPEDGFQPIDLG